MCFQWGGRSSVVPEKCVKLMGGCRRTESFLLSLTLTPYLLVYSPQSPSHSFQLSNLPNMLKNTHTSNTYNGLEVKFGQVYLHDSLINALISLFLKIWLFSYNHHTYHPHCQSHNVFSFLFITLRYWVRRTWSKEGHFCSEILVVGSHWMYWKQRKRTGWMNESLIRPVANLSSNNLISSSAQKNLL